MGQLGFFTFQHCMSWSEKDHPVDAKKQLIFVCNEYGHNNPFFIWKKLYTFLRSKITRSVSFQVSIKNVLSVLTTLGVKLIFCNNELIIFFLLFASVANITLLLINNFFYTFIEAKTLWYIGFYLLIWYLEHVLLGVSVFFVRVFF